MTPQRTLCSTNAAAVQGKMFHTERRIGDQIRVHRSGFALASRVTIPVASRSSWTHFAHHPTFPPPRKTAPGRKGRAAFRISCCVRSGGFLGECLEHLLLHGLALGFVDGPRVAQNIYVAHSDLGGEIAFRRHGRKILNHRRSALLVQRDAALGGREGEKAQLWLSSPICQYGCACHDS